MIHSPTTTNCLFLLLSLHSLLFSFPYGDGFPAGKGRNVDAIRRKNEDLDAERALNRTMTKLRSEHGRFIMLACKTKCLKERAEIPNWIRDFNSLQNRSNNRLMINKSSGNQTPASQNDDPPLGFHFHFYRRPFPDTEMEKAMKSPKAAIFYVVGGKAFPAGAGILGKKEKFMKWLEKFEQAKIARMPEEEMDAWLNSECHGDWLPRKRAENQLTLLVIHDHEYCPETLLNNFARSFADNQNFLALDLQRPLADEAEFILHWRLPGLSNNCRMGILLLGNQYLELPAGILGSELHNIGQNLTDQGNANRNCSTVNIGIGADELHMQDILPPLNSIELEFLREEKHLKAIEQNRQYLTVGAIGGVSILALAMSIFWGLNGNDFVPKQ